MKYHIITYGCQMNHSDSERIASILNSAGIKSAKDMNNADLLIINSCSVRQSAINRIYGQLLNFRRRPGLRQTVLTGCVLEADRKKFKDKFDLIIDIKELTENPKKLIDSLNISNEEFKAFSYTDYFKINPQYRSNFGAYIPIMTGCNNFCSYCAVPYTRGREISRPANEIINEVEQLIKKGYKEITLLGQNVNSYKSEILNTKFETNPKSKITNSKQIQKSNIIDFPKLLKMINDIPGDFWIRFLTSHPKDMSSGLIKMMVRCEKVCKYIHLPIQAGDDEVLRKMNRHYTANHYLKLIEKIKKAYHLEVELPSALGSSTSKLPIAISTDIIVGFPGETKTQFTNTAKMMRKVKYDMAYLAEYSPRPGTAAAKLKDDVPILEKKRRKEFLNDILRKTALANNKKYVGKTVDILIEKVEASFMFGKTRTFKNVKVSTASIPDCHPELVSGSIRLGKASKAWIPKQVRNDKIKLGQFALIKITKAGPWGLEGKISQ